ncbi:MAG: Mrp/NBP35 family ATP-binding protein [Thermoprotei archaeon]
MEQVLSDVPYPELNRSIVDVDAVQDVKEAEGSYTLTLKVPYPGYVLEETLRSDVEWAAAQAGFKIRVQFSEGGSAWANSCLKHSNKPGESGRGARTGSGGAKESEGGSEEEIEIPLTASNQTVDHGHSTGISPLERGGVRKIIAVASGKGGVGKSFIAATMATHLRLLGFNVAILDADITGPCISRMLGVAGLPKLRRDGRIDPIETPLGTRLMAVDLIMDRFKTPLIWRGPLINSAIRGLFSETAWGDVHYLIVDLPPGTSDAPLTVFQSLRPDGVLFVTSPMLVAKTVVARAITMAKELDAPILGVVENMSYMVSANGVKLNVFGRPGAEEAAKDLGVNYLGSLPIDPAVSALADRGEIELYRNPELFKIARLVRFGLLKCADPSQPVFWARKEQGTVAE